jgi:tRNA A37 methylthiotransferase MiaB
VGRTLPALVEGPGKEQELVWEARLEGMAPEIDGKLYLSDLEPPSGGAPARSGDIAMVEITASHDYDLVGRVTEIREGLPRSTPPLASHAARQIPTGSPLRVLA